MFTKGYDNAYENVSKFLEFLNASLLEQFNFLYIFEIILKLSSLFLLQIDVSMYFLPLCRLLRRTRSFKIASSAFPSRQLFNRIILYLAGSSVSSTMLSKVAQKCSNLVLSPLNFGSLILSKFLSTRLTGNSCVFFGFGAFSSSKSISDEAEPIDGAFFVREAKNSLTLEMSLSVSLATLSISVYIY